jgi:hypothetical protein
MSNVVRRQNVFDSSIVAFIIYRFPDTGTLEGPPR